MSTTDPLARQVGGDHYHAPIRAETIGEVRSYQLVNMDLNDRIRFDNCRHLLVDRIKPIKPVLTKQDFYRRFYAGEFGNHGPMWSSLEAWRESRYDKPIAIRVLSVGGRCDYNIAAQDVEQRTEDFMRDGWTDLNWSAMAPTERTTLQGEVMRSSSGLELFASRVRLPMRDALRSGGFRASGLRAQMLIASHLDASSREWLDHLLDTYPDHVIEFSTFAIPWGVAPHRNTVIWEVRRY